MNCWVVRHFDRTYIDWTVGCGQLDTNKYSRVYDNPRQQKCQPHGLIWRKSINTGVRDTLNARNDPLLVLNRKFEN